MRSRLFLILLICGAATASTASTAPEAPAARLIRVSDGACVTMTEDQPTGYRLTNSCSSCRTALVSWCDGAGHPFDVLGHGSTHVPACRGFQNLITEVPCEHNH